MLEWLVDYGTAVQAIAAVVSLMLTIVAIGVTWWYVAVTKDIAETTQRQLAAVLQPMITVEINPTIYGNSIEGFGRTTYHQDGRFTITNIGTSPVKLRTVASIIILLEIDNRLHQHVQEIVGYFGQVLMPKESLAEDFSIDVPSPAWQHPDALGLRITCTDLSELIEHEFLLRPPNTMGHSSKILNRHGPFERLRRIAAKLEAKVDELPDLKNPSRTSQKDE